MEILQMTSSDGELLTATFAPEKGMNLLSYKKGSKEAIDQQTKGLFEERFAGLGALIGPHFHHRKDDEIPPLSNPNLFPHIKPILDKGQKEVFSHGIARYVPWTYKRTGDVIEGILKGDDQFQGVFLKDLEGQNFQMTFKAFLDPHGLNIELSVENDKASIVGFHYYYALYSKMGVVRSDVEENYHPLDGWRPIPKSWKDSKGHLRFTLDQSADYGFRAKDGIVALETEDHFLKIQYKVENDENSFQLYHPANESFVCIEPVTAKDPRDVKQNKSSIKIHIEII